MDIDNLKPEERKHVLNIIREFCTKNQIYAKANTVGMGMDYLEESILLLLKDNKIRIVHYEEDNSYSIVYNE